jgi:hypothetical protein
MSDGATKGLQLVANDIRRAHVQLVANGVEVSEITRLGKNPPDFEGDELGYIGFISFSDPDGNEWAVQQISSRS